MRGSAALRGLFFFQEAHMASKKSADRERIKKLVRNAMKGLETRLGGEDKPSIGDYLKVMQLQKEIEEDGPKEIKVTWVEPETPTSESEG